jgi:conjugative transfer pilus assembly protein TraH
MKHFGLWVIPILLVTVPDCLGATTTMAQQLQRYFNSVGGGSNITGASTYQNQAAGYYNGGSFYGRVPVQTANLANIQLPGFRAGCGGIDAWFGGLSHISAQQLVNFLRQVGGNLASYAFMLAIESVSPEIYNVMNELNALAQKVNSLSMNTCEMAATALGGMLPQSDATSKHLCQMMGSSYGGISDWTAARHQCGIGGNRHRILDSRHEGILDTFKDQFNLVWQAIRKNTFLSGEDQGKRLAELFMTLAGTLIVKRNANTNPTLVSYSTTHFKSRATDQQFIQALLYGGTVQLYHCGADGERCLNLTLRPETIRQNDDALVGRVHQVLTSITGKIYNDTALTDPEKGFLNSTTLPVYKILNVLTAFKKGHTPIEINSYAELIALDILNHFLLEVLDIVEESISHLRKAQVSDVAIKEYLSNLQQVRLLIIGRRESAMAHMNALLTMIQSVQMVEKQLHVYLGTVSTAGEANWS